MEKKFKQQDKLNRRNERKLQAENAALEPAVEASEASEGDQPDDLD